ncbi:hypothetical protein CLU92_1782 [Janthinobacterium sp. 61]|uniref:hypothetical protein n=1 Tax=Janthinobacterium sp. 61 TaxID=2035209 RepID=UPI000CAA0AD5|nr:hypothetical protein [Janthinobacterium sp. 61]PKV44442.1 hypothetical protein CLU92_1782 [Janthinobacterium sp. 61]
MPNNAKQTAVFGRNVLNNGSIYLRHVHMVPFTPGPPPVIATVAVPAASGPAVSVVTSPAPSPAMLALQKWRDVYNHNQQHSANQDQTSNRYLFYAMDKNHGFLLIAMINIGAHSIWDSKYAPVLSNWESIASDFVNLGTIPDA